jgi:hypothetical protein
MSQNVAIDEFFDEIAFFSFGVVLDPDYLGEGSPLG